MAFPSKLPSPRLSRWIGSKLSYLNSNGPLHLDFYLLSLLHSQAHHTLVTKECTHFLPSLMLCSCCSLCLDFSPKGCRSTTTINLQMKNGGLAQGFQELSLKTELKTLLVFLWASASVPKVPMNISTLVLKVSWIKCFLFSLPRYMDLLSVNNYVLLPEPFCLSLKKLGK